MGESLVRSLAAIKQSGIGMATDAENQRQLDDFAVRGSVRLGPWASYTWRLDPKRLCFQLSRYKFISKMLSGKRSVLEVGCGDAMGTPIVLQEVGRVHCIDIEPLVIEETRERYADNPNLSFEVCDITCHPCQVMDGCRFDAAYSLDVLEHIHKEKAFLDNICACLSLHGVLIIGTPNQSASEHASELSRSGHINLKSAESLNALMARHFYNVFNFSMNDEVVHTGFSPMAHYLFSMGVGVKPGIRSE